MPSICSAHSVGFELRFELVKRYSCFKFIARMPGGDDMDKLFVTSPTVDREACGRLPQRPCLHGDCLVRYASCGLVSG